MSGILNLSFLSNRIGRKSIRKKTDVLVKRMEKQKEQRKKQKQRPKMMMTEKVYQEIKNTIGSFRAEQGGILGSSDGQLIDHFYWDKEANTGLTTYSPNVELINHTILPNWNQNQIKLIGFVHSHPKGFTKLSGGDLIYAKKLMEALGEQFLYLPIVQSENDGDFELYCYSTENMRGKTPRVISHTLEIQESYGKDSKRFLKAKEKEMNDKNKECKKYNEFKNDNEVFHSRVEEIYPLSVMRKKTLIVVGCGGAGEYIESMARTGIGRIILFDEDIYSETNLATQNVYRDEIGINKAIALKNRIKRIDPNIEVLAVPKFLDDEISDEMFEQYVGEKIQCEACAKDILLAACTDNFYAQARCSKLALKYAMPLISAQLYEKGLGSEIFFTYPGVTPACGRCMTSSRYHSYLKENYQNQVGSHQSPIFATQRTNSLKGFISLMLLLYREVEGNAFYAMLDDVKNRNFVQIRMSSNFKNEIFDREFQHSPYTFFDEALWITQTPDDGKGDSPMPICPDCLGLGDLKRRKGKMKDTRRI